MNMSHQNRGLTKHVFSVCDVLSPYIYENKDHPDRVVLTLGSESRVEHIVVADSAKCPVVLFDTLEYDTSIPRLTALTGGVCHEKGTYLLKEYLNGEVVWEKHLQFMNAFTFAEVMELATLIGTEDFDEAFDHMFKQNRIGTYEFIFCKH